MSNPPNRLASFRSYSYYHVLAMCDCSQTADTLAKSTSLNVWEHATAETRIADSRPEIISLGKYSPKAIQGAGNYIILINGASDASYIIDKAQWMSSTGASASPGDKSTSIAVEGSIVVSEPKGIAFLDQIVRCCGALGVDSAQVVYVLKTFFVGHAFDSAINEDYSDHITDIPPITFITYDVQGAFTTSGGLYTLEFVGAGHGAARLPQYSKAVNAMSVTGGNSLASTLAILQDNINTNYEKYFNCVYDQVGSLPGQAFLLANYLRKVKYVIEVGEDYKDTNGIKYTVSNQPQQYKNTAGCNDPAQITFPAHTSIESAINQIMLMSPQVQADMAVGDTSTNVKYEYKIHTAISSTRVSDGISDGKIDYVVYYRVERFTTPKTIAYDPSFQVLAQDDKELKQDDRYLKIKNNIIEFDYLYTGKNIDILEFDMKVNLGLAYLQTATIANTFKTQLDVAPNRVMQPAGQDLNSFNVKLGSPVQIPVFFGSQIKTNALTNTQNGSHAIQSAYTLSKHSSLEVTDVTMKILGNSELLGSTNRTTSPEYVIKSATSSTDSITLNTSAKFSDWSHAPAYVKIKIKMPRDSDDVSLFSGQTSSNSPSTDNSIDYAKDFWFDGFYYVVGVTHTFDGGEFTQTLQLLGIPKKSSFDATNTNKQTEVNVNTTVGTCFDNKIGISNTPAPTQPPPVVPHTPPSGTTTPTNTADSNTVNNAAKNPSDVKGWDKASPQVQFAIIDASNKYGVDVVVMAQFAAKESGFNPNAKAPTSSASGLYQFLTATWNGLVKAGKVLGLNANSPDERFNPNYNAFGGAAFLRDNAAQIKSNDVGDLYLAHFLGPSTAAKVITRDNATGGQELLSTALGSSAAQKIAAANSTIVNANTTVGELRAWAAKAMAKTLKNPVEVAKKQNTPPPTASPTQPSPTSNPDATKRTADQPVAVVQNKEAQQAKKDSVQCGPTPTSGSK